MGDAAGEAAQGFHLLRLSELILHGLRWVMSRAIDEIPTTAPARFMTGEIAVDTRSLRPSL